MDSRNDPPDRMNGPAGRVSTGTEAVLVDRFSLRACFGRAVRMVWQNWWLFLAICTVFYGASEIINLFEIDSLFGKLEAQFTASGSLFDLAVWFLWGVLLELPYYFLSIVADAIIAFVVVAQLRGQYWSMTIVLQRIGVIFFPLLVFCAIDNLAVGFSYFTWKIPLFLFALFFWLSAQSMCVEKLGPFTAMKRSLYLTSGNRLRFAGVVLAIFAMWEIEGYAFDIYSAFSFYSLFDIGHANGIEMISEGIMGSFIATLLATAYHDLRSVKEYTPEKRAIEAFE